MNFEDAGAFIRGARRQAKITQVDLAKRSGLKQATISQLETGVISDLGVRKLSKNCNRLALEVRIQRRLQPLMLIEAYAENSRIGRRHSRTPTPSWPN